MKQSLAAREEEGTWSFQLTGCPGASPLHNGIPIQTQTNRGLFRILGSNQRREVLGQEGPIDDAGDVEFQAFQSKHRFPGGRHENRAT